MFAGMNKEDYTRYGRQMICQDFGISGQVCLSKARVLIVGAGGLGCPVGLYLACAGVKYLRIVDDDIVELSNLHRQVLHPTEAVDQAKVVSMKKQLLLRNPTIIVEDIQQRVTSDNVLEISDSCDIIIDCSDNAATRYLLNDIAVLTQRPLVSGSAIGTSGQVSVFNYRENNEGIYSPCYRCVFPEFSKYSQSCSDDGVLGPVTGMIGSLQAMEAIKVLQRKSKYEVMCGKLLMVDFMMGRFQPIKYLKKEDCILCGKSPSITLSNYMNFLPAESCSLVPETNIPSVGCVEYKSLKEKSHPHILLDVRNSIQFEICSLPDAKNIPLAELEATDIQEIVDREEDVFVICRRGIDSVQAVEILLKRGLKRVFNISGGLLAWTNTVDDSFPTY